MNCSKHIFWSCCAAVMMIALTGCSTSSSPEAKTTTPANTPSATTSDPVTNPGSPLETARQTWAQAQSNDELKGDIKVDGSSTVYPITEAAAASFKKLFPNVNTTVGKSGTGGGFKRFQTGETDISDASRPIKDKELQACQEKSVSFIEIPVAYDGLTIVAHKDNDFLDTLTVDQLKTIFLADKAAKTWKDVNPDWPAEEIKVFAPGTDSGTFDYFKEVIAGKEGSIRSDMSTSENDDVLVNGVAGDEFGIGFFGAAYYFQNMDKLKAVKVVNPATDKAVLPTAETIENGSYAPFSRPLFIYVNKESINKPQVEQFVDFYIAKAADFSKEVGYVALPNSVYEAGLENFISENVGTHYLTAEMEKRSGPVTEVYSKDNLVK